MNDLQHPARRPGGEWILALLLACALGALAATVGFACRSATHLAAANRSEHLLPSFEQAP